MRKQACTERTPALVHAKVIRPYSHSLSDDERLYKTPEERTAEARRDPIPRLRHLLLSQGYATEAQLAARLDHENIGRVHAVGSDAKLSVAQGGDLGPGEVDAPVAIVDENEVVARAGHLGEFN